MEAAEFYTGIVAEAYAPLRSMTFDPSPYAKFVRSRGEPALEIGCGDGDPLLDLCEAGLDVDGVDSSLDMVERCRAHAAQRCIETSVFHQRAEDLALDRQYAAVYFAGPTFNLLPDDETAQRALRRIGHHLTDDGVALIPLWIPPPTPPDELGVARVAIDDRDGVTDGAETELRFTPLAEVYDAATRTRTTSCRYERISEGQRSVAERNWVLHWHTPNGFAELADAAGLAVESLTDAQTRNPASDGSTMFTAIVSRSAL